MFTYSFSLGSGAIANFDVGTIQVGDETKVVLAKTAKVARDNDLMQAERYALDRMGLMITHNLYKQCVPKLYAVTRTSTGLQQHILEYFPGFFTAKQIKEANPQ